ncbi:MAG TPA: hypothetical protein VN682_19305, partial [Terriglobales bacterium]|nr:hypothetical protein [Terriglobales bacterium]
MKRVFLEREGFGWFYITLWCESKQERWAFVAPPDTARPDQERTTPDSKPFTVFRAQAIRGVLWAIPT